MTIKYCLFSPSHSQYWETEVQRMEGAPKAIHGWGGTGAKESLVPRAALPTTDLSEAWGQPLPCQEVTGS
jgi:hypothetical protein